MGLRSIVKALYVADDGTHYQFRQQQQLMTQVGNSLAVGTEPSKPFGMRLRRIHATVFLAGGPDQAVGKFTRSAVIGSVTNPLWTGADRSVQLNDYESAPGVGQVNPNVEQAFTVTGRTGEAQTY